MANHASAIYSATIAANAADALYQESLTRHYGREACNMRYRPDLQNEECKNLGRAYRAAAELMQEAWKAHREEQSRLRQQEWDKEDRERLLS